MDQVTVPVGTQEPCLIYSACNFCNVAGDSSCLATGESLANDFPTRNVTRRYGAHVEYKCGLGKEFMGALYGQTDATVRMECGWDGQWSPISTLNQCTWVSWDGIQWHCKSRTMTYICDNALDFCTDFWKILVVQIRLEMVL